MPMSKPADSVFGSRGSGGFAMLATPLPVSGCCCLDYCHLPSSRVLLASLAESCAACRSLCVKWTMRRFSCRAVQSTCESRIMSSAEIINLLKLQTDNLDDVVDFRVLHNLLVGRLLDVEQLAAQGKDAVPVATDYPEPGQH